MLWSYGVTTVPSRRGNLLPKTLASLKEGGFPAPQLFVDGDRDGVSWYREFNLEVTMRFPPLLGFGNWFNSMVELSIRTPNADLYVIFQDDLITYKNLRLYLENCKYPDRGYLNLYTFPENHRHFEREGNDLRAGFAMANQRGLGALGLVFSNEALSTLLHQPHFVDRPKDAAVGTRKIDGCVVSAMNKAGWKEYVHYPSLVQHTGLLSAMRNEPSKMAVSFKGEAFDAMELLKGRRGERAFPLLDKNSTLREIECLERAIHDDRNRLAVERDPGVRRKLVNYITTYGAKVKELKRKAGLS